MRWASSERISAQSLSHRALPRSLERHPAWVHRSATRRCCSRAVLPFSRARQNNMVIFARSRRANGKLLRLAAALLRAASRGGSSSRCISAQSLQHICASSLLRSYHGGMWRHKPPAITWATSLFCGMASWRRKIIRRKSALHCSSIMKTERRNA